jgi:hypothetical protein
MLPMSQIFVKPTGQKATMGAEHSQTKPSRFFAQAPSFLFHHKIVDFPDPGYDFVGRKKNCTRAQKSAKLVASAEAIR